MNNIERRESPRMQIVLRCHVTSPALWSEGAMYTEDMSRSGVLIAWRGENGPVPPPLLGQILTVEIELPANHGFGQKCIHCQGTVVRIAEREGTCPQVALEINYMDFRSFHDRVRAAGRKQPASISWMS